MTNVPPQKKSSASHEKRNAELKVTFINYDFIFCNHKFCFGNFQKKNPEDTLPDYTQFTD